MTLIRLSSSPEVGGGGGTEVEKKGEGVASTKGGYKRVTGSEHRQIRMYAYENVVLELIRYH